MNDLAVFEAETPAVLSGREAGCEVGVEEGGGGDIVGGRTGGCEDVLERVEGGPGGAVTDGVDVDLVVGFVPLVGLAG